jgi:non-ribosomal peptide synthetase component F/thioesterase domain-containing protein
VLALLGERVCGLSSVIDPFGRLGDSRQSGACSEIRCAADPPLLELCAWHGRIDLDSPADAPFNDEWLERPIFSRFQEIVVRHGDRIAVDDGSRRLTFHELLCASAHLAERIAELMPAGGAVGILLPHGAMFPVAALACLAAGRPFVPIDLCYPASRNERVIHQAQVIGLIASGESGVANSYGIPWLDVERSLVCRDVPACLHAPAEGPAIILYTSGSTGDPKGICNDQRAILQRVWHATNACHLSSQDRLLLLSSFSTIAGIRDICAALLNGASAYVADPHRLGARGVLRAFSEVSPTFAYTVPALLRQLLQLPGAREALRYVRIIRLGGDLTLASDLAMYRKILPRVCQLLIGFGSTEVPTIFHWFVPRDWNPKGAHVPLGFAQPGFEFRLVDDRSAPVAPGQPGELLVRSRYLALGLWQGGRVQPGPFTTDPDDPTVRMLRTGDLVRPLPDGLYEMVGRADRQIKIRGLRVDPAEPEAVLRACKSVSDVALIVRRQGEGALKLIAYVVPKGSPTPALVRDLKQALAARLPQHLHPAEIRFLEAIPQLPGFKPDLSALADIDRQKLASEAELTIGVGEGALTGDALPRTRSGPQSQTLQSDVTSRVLGAVRRAWTTVLDRRSFHNDVPWEDAGGDSLNIMQLWFMIEDELGRSFPLEILIGRTTPTQLIDSIEREMERGTSRQCDQGASYASRPRVFFVPPPEGDAPVIARFLHELRGEIDFRVVRYPNWTQLIDAGTEINTVAHFVVEQVLAQGGEAECSFLGYSLGGFVAWEAARGLQNIGVRIRFVGLIDTRSRLQLRCTESFLDGVTRRLKALCGQPRNTLADVWWRRIFPRIIEQTPPVLLRQVGPVLIHAKLTSTVGWHLLLHLRRAAVLRWAPEPLDVPTWLFRSDEFPARSPDFDWGKLCGQLHVVPVGGSHETVFDPPNMLALCEKVASAVRSTTVP